MKILGVDPGYGRCGIALVAHESGTNDRVLESHCIETSGELEFAARLHCVVQEFREWIKKHKPDLCAMERLYMTKNQKTAMQVAEVRGALLLAAYEHNLPVHELGPNEVKVAITGNGRANKEQVSTMIDRMGLLQGKKTPVFDDEYDAVAIAITAGMLART